MSDVDRMARRVMGVWGELASLKSIQDEVNRELGEFIAKHPVVGADKSLREHMGHALQSGYARDLEGAYKHGMAHRLLAMG